MQPQTAPVHMRNVSQDSVCYSPHISGLSSDLCTSVLDLRQQSQHYATDRNDHVMKAKKALAELIEPNRTLRAKLSSLQQHVEEIQKGLEKLRKDNVQSTWFFY